jgi:hypothetical protein
MKEINAPGGVEKIIGFKITIYNIILGKKQYNCKRDDVFQEMVKLLHYSSLFKFLTCLIMLYNDIKTDNSDNTMVKTEEFVYFSSSHIPK